VNYAKKCLDVLKEFIDSEDEAETRKELVGLSIDEKIFAFVDNKFNERRVSDDLEEKEVSKGLEEFRNVVRSYKEKYGLFKKEKSKLLLTEEDLSKVEKAHSDFFKKLKKLSSEKSKLGYWECISTLEDLNVIILAIKNGSQSDIIEAIKEGEIKYIEGGQCGDIKENKKEEKRDENYKDYQTCTSYRNKKECNVCEKNVVHAEMKIINSILEKKSLLTSAMEVDNETLFEYIGISKLTCLPCHVTIGILNPLRKENCVCGTHGSTYRS
jgi:hypothetical protein